MENKTQQKMVVIAIRPEIHGPARIAALKAGETLNALATRAIRRELERLAKKARA